jgi:PAS domain S-box-containing protein/putative nucleotidyltransferase with HDIG domain
LSNKSNGIQSPTQGDNSTIHIRENALSILHNLPDIVYEIDTKGYFTFINNSVIRLGYRPEELLGQHFSTIIHPEDVESVSRFHVLKKIRQKKTEQTDAPKLFDERRSGERSTLNLEVRLISKADTREDISTSTKIGSLFIFTDISASGHYMQPARSKKKEFMGTIGIIRDITDRKMAESGLNQYLKKLQKSVESTIYSMARIVETRDLYTAGHQQRTAALATSLARELDLPDDNTLGLRMATLVHDIGKIYVPAELLSKPSALSPDEFAMIKNHPQIGYNILKDIEFPWPLADIILQHHERLNGSGYPNNLIGEKIMFEAKILAVADVVEAMSSHRPYRPAIKLETTLGEITSNKGILYDTDVVDSCLKLFKKKGFRFPDPEHN